MGPRSRPFIDFTSTYTADYSSGGRGRAGRPARSLSAAPTYRPSAGSIPTSGRPSTRGGQDTVSILIDLFTAQIFNFQ